MNANTCGSFPRSACIGEQELGKIMALDVGEKTIGVAFCEEETRIAFPGKTIWRQEGKKRDMAGIILWQCWDLLFLPDCVLQAFTF